MRLSKLARTATAVGTGLMLWTAGAAQTPPAPATAAAPAKTPPPARRGPQLDRYGKALPAGTSGLRTTPNESFRPRARQLLYVALPGSLETPAYRNGVGVVVLDAANDYLFVKRIPTFEYAGSVSPEQIAGFTASPMTNMMYVSARGRIGAWDLATDKKVWETALDGWCCERPQVTPDGKYVVVGSDLRDYWFVLDARTGALVRKLDAPKSPGAHNLNLSPDGKLAFMSPNNPVLTVSEVDTGKIVKEITFSDHVRPFVLNRDASKIYANVGNISGFEVADVKTGKILAHVETSGDWKAKWNATPQPRIPHGCPSHGIALVNNEREVWVANGVDNLVHIFDNTKAVPVEVATIKPTNGVYWIMVGLDGKLAYLSSGDIVDVRTRQIVGSQKDEFGRMMYSEKQLDMTFRDGKLQRVANQFGNGYGELDNMGKTNMNPAN